MTGYNDHESDAETINALREALWDLVNLDAELRDGIVSEEARTKRVAAAKKVLTEGRVTL